MFFKALGLGVAAPVAFRLARSSLAVAAPGAKRFFLFYIPHGIAPEHYNPQVSDGDRTSFALDQTNLSILGPLQPYNQPAKKYVNVYQGLKYPGGSTHTGIVSCLSGAATVDTTTRRTTVEHVIAKGLGKKPLILGACSHIPFQLDANGMLFWDGSPVDPEKNPAKAADALFGGGTAAPVSVDVQLRKDLLLLTASDIQALQTELGGLTTEKTKLQRHLEAIQGLGVDAAPSQSTCSSAPLLPTVEMVRRASAGQVVEPGGGNDYFYQEANFRLIFQAQLELVAQALICNAAPVIALMPMFATCDFKFDFTQSGMDVAPVSWAHHNGLSHTGPQAAPYPLGQYNSPLSINNLNSATRAAFARAQLWFTQQLVSKVVQPLAEADDPSAPGTKVLDNTLIYLMSEVGDGQDHTTGSKILYPQTPTYLPLVSIGKCGGAIKAGQVVRYDVDHPAGELYLAFAQAMGVTGASFPDAVQPAPGVLA